MVKRTAKGAQEKQEQEQKNGTKFIGPLNFAGLDMQVSQGVINMYKQALTQREAEVQEFTAKLIDDLKILREEVPGLKDRLAIYDDAYEVFALEPEE